MPTGIYPRKTLAERFWNKVDVKGPNNCWKWMASKRDGYGRIWNGKKNLNAHRLSWEIHYGPIPKGMCVLHHCDVRACVNPRHLFLGLNTDNVHDMERKGRSVHPRGKANGRAKLSEGKVREIRVLLASGLTLSTIGRRYGVDLTSIWAIKIGETWAWLQ